MTAMRHIALPLQNDLLAALSHSTQERLLPHLELVELPRGKVIHEIGEKLRYAYFPVDAIVALLTVIENGACSEVSMVGNEGILGISFFMGGESSPRRAVVQSPGFAYRLLGKRVKDEFDRHGELLILMLRYTQSLITQMAQTAMCNRHHTIDQQLCRLLLQSLDRLQGDEVEITHEVIANMLGVRRESISESAGQLKALGLIECRRGKIRVIDRPGVEKRCCECYEVVKKETNRLLPYSRPQLTATTAPRIIKHYRLSAVT